MHLVPFVLQTLGADEGRVRHFLCQILMGTIHNQSLRLPWCIIELAHLSGDEGNVRRLHDFAQAFHQIVQLCLIHWSVFGIAVRLALVPENAPQCAGG